MFLSRSKNSLISLVSRHSFKSFANKPRPKSLAQKQFEKEMSQKIIQTEETEDEFLQSHINIPFFLNLSIFTLQLPTIPILFNAYGNDFFSAAFTNSIALSYDWLGFSIVGMTGAYFGLLTRNDWRDPEVKEKQPSLLFPVAVVPLVSCAAACTMVYSFNPFSWAPMVIGMMSSLYFDSKIPERSLGPRYWMAYKIRLTLFWNIILMLTSFSLLTFRDYIYDSEKLLGAYEAMANPKTPSRLDVIPQEDQQPEGQKTIRQQVLEQRKKVIDLLADPTK